MSQTKKLIALDADGVLLDYNAAYAIAWKNTFGTLPKEVNPNAYWPIDRYGVPRLSGADLSKFRNSFDEKFWSSIPLIDGAKEACFSLLRLGYELICITALPAKFLDARRANLIEHGLPIKEVRAVEHSESVVISPKADLLNELMPCAFVDDYLPYFKGVSKKIHKALVLREQDGSPNVGDGLVSITTSHENLLSFAKFWEKEPGHHHVVFVEDDAILPPPMHVTKRLDGSL